MATLTALSLQCKEEHADSDCVQGHQGRDRCPVIRKRGLVDLVDVSDASKLKEAGPDSQVLSGADAGVIAENVYLFCASEGLSAVLRAGIDRDALARELQLKPKQKIILAQSVGYPNK